MSELNKEEVEKEFERLRDEHCKLLKEPSLPCSPQPISTPEQISARNKWQINKNE